MSDDPLERLRKRFQSAAKVPTSALGRLRRTAGAALKVGVGRLTGSGDEAIFEQLAAQLGELKGVAMKAGQIMSYLDTNLPEEAKRLLAVLQVSSQPTPFEEIERVLREDGLEALVPLLERTPVATASIGQVHRATLPASWSAAQTLPAGAAIQTGAAPPSGGTRVAVKVQHPGIEQAIAADFRSAAAGSALPAAMFHGVAEMIAEARDTFLAECDYVAEAKWQAQFRAFTSTVTIPEVHPKWCSRHVLTTSWVDGLPFERFAATASQAARDRAGVALYSFYVGTVYAHGLFNGDPHPGNLLFAEDGAVTVLDFGCVRQFEPAMVGALKALSRAVRADDASAIRRALVELGAAEPDAKGWDATRALLRGFFGPTLVKGPHRIESGLSLEAKQLMKDKLAVGRMRLPARLLFLFRIRFGLHSELVRLRSVADWAALEGRLCGESAAAVEVD